MLKMESKDNMELPFFSDAAFKGNCCLGKKNTDSLWGGGGGGGGGVDRGEWWRYDDGWDNKPTSSPSHWTTTHLPPSLPPTIRWWW